MNAKLDYEAFCRAAPDLPIFHQIWYLDAVCMGGEWSVVFAKKGERIIASWPFFLKKKLGFPHVAMPILARLHGPYLLPEFRTTEHEISILSELLAQMPTNLVAFEQDFHYQMQNWLPLFWKNFRQTTRYSYVLRPLDDLDFLWKKMTADYRNNKIKKAEKLVRLRTDLTIEDFWRIQNLSFSRQGHEPPLALDFLKKMDATLAKNEARQLFFAVDEAGNIHSAAYLIWDNTSSYLLMAGDDPQHRASGAGIWLTWELVKFTRNSLKINQFDFLGSMQPNIERVRRKFGAEPQPYFRVQKEWNWVWKLAKFWLR